MYKKQLTIIVLVLSLCVAICKNEQPDVVYAVEGDIYQNPKLTTQSVVSVDSVFGQYQKTVDENIYYSLSTVNSKTMVRIYGNYDTPMFNKAKEYINPCMAFATTWGEAGQSYKGVSLTTVMDFHPDTYNTDIDWISVSRNLSQVNSDWYLTNATRNINTNIDGEACGMPVALLQYSRTTTREQSTMTGLGVGPYQITSTDWSRWDLDNRVNPVYGFEDSLEKCGTSWITCGIDPISDLTVYAVLSLSHQGGGLINYNFGKELINIINTPSVQQAFLDAGYQMYIDAREKAYSRPISLSDINVTPYLAQIESQTGYNFSDYTGGVGITNKGDYTTKHLLRYVFYKYYYTLG